MPALHPLGGVGVSVAAPRPQSCVPRPLSFQDGLRAPLGRGPQGSVPSQPLGHTEAPTWHHSTYAKFRSGRKDLLVTAASGTLAGGVASSRQALEGTSSERLSGMFPGLVEAVMTRVYVSVKKPPSHTRTMGARCMLFCNQS